MWNTVNASNNKSPRVTVRGELKERIIINSARLSAAIYRPSEIYTQDKAGWPGDWEGRTLLALVSQWRYNSEPAYVKALVEGLPEHFNERGYLGKIYGPGIFDEQQLSGHNWLLRGLMEYSMYTGDAVTMQYAKNIVDRLYKPLRGHYGSYPTEPEVRGNGGSYSGTITGQEGGWITSSDIGCAFMCFDALGQYYALTKDNEVYCLLAEMLEAFEKIDFVEAHMQTHATLSAVRGILNVYVATGEERFLAAAIRIFELYEGFGMTENYGNFNWFGRYDTWTEPCAITDSLMVALKLFDITGKCGYLTAAQRIYYNAFCYAQRSNGGFGTDTTVGPVVKRLRPSGDGISEAFWCCTMRGAEGLRTVGDHLFLVNETGELLVTFCENADLDERDYSVTVNSGMPYEGTVKIELSIKNPKGNIPKSVKIFDGREILKKEFSMIDGSHGIVELSITPEKHNEPAKYDDGYKVFFGNLLMSQNTENEQNCNLLPLTNVRDLDDAAIRRENRKIIFQEESIERQAD